jgi:DNA repair exonuclease SbcCD ATPase subunit
LKISKEENSDSEALIEALKNGNRALKEHNTSLEQRNSNLEEAQLKLTRKLGEANRKLSNLSEDCTKKQATVEHAQSQLQNTVDQHGKWIHEHYNVNVARIESRVKPLTDEVRKLRADVDGRPQQEDITKLKEQMKEQLKEQMQDFRRASTNIGVSQEALTTALACHQYTYQQRGRRNPDDHWMRNNPLAVIYQ